MILWSEMLQTSSPSNSHKASLALLTSISLFHTVRKTYVKDRQQVTLNACANSDVCSCLRLCSQWPPLGGWPNLIRKSTLGSQADVQFTLFSMTIDMYIILLTIIFSSVKENMTNSSLWGNFVSSYVMLQMFTALTYF